MFNMEKRYRNKIIIIIIIIIMEEEGVYALAHAFACHFI